MTEATLAAGLAPGAIGPEQGQSRGQSRPTWQNGAVLPAMWWLHEIRLSALPARLWKLFVEQVGGHFPRLPSALREIVRRAAGLK